MDNSIIFFTLPTEILVMIFEYVIDQPQVRFPYYLMMIHPRIRNFLTKYIFRSAYLTTVCQSRLYDAPFNSLFRNIMRSNASYAHWENDDIRSTCNYIKRRLHPAVITFYLKECVKALIHVRVLYTQRNEEGVRERYLNSMLTSDVFKYRQFIMMFITIYMDTMKRVMKHKIKIIIVKNDFINVKVISKASSIFDKYRMAVTLSLPDALDAAAGQYQHTANSLLNAESSINALFEWLNDSILNNIDENCNNSPTGIRICSQSVNELKSKLEELLYLLC